MNRIVILFLFLVIACQPKPAPPLMATDTAGTVLMAPAAVLINVPCPAIDSLITEQMKIKKERDSLKTELFMAQFTVTRVKYYLDICLKNPSQDKFLKGWIKRAIQ